MNAALTRQLAVVCVALGAFGLLSGTLGLRSESRAAGTAILQTLRGGAAVAKNVWCTASSDQAGGCGCQPGGGAYLFCEPRMDICLCKDNIGTQCQRGGTKFCDGNVMMECGTNDTKCENCTDKGNKCGNDKQSTRCAGTMSDVDPSAPNCGLL